MALVREKMNQIEPLPVGGGGVTEASTLQSSKDAAHRLPAAVAINDTDPSVLVVTGAGGPEGLLANSTPNSLLSNTARTVHMQPASRINVNNHPPQYGNFYQDYDPMTGARTAAILGSFLLLLVFYIIYKAKCHQNWTDEDDYYLQQYKQRQAKKALGQGQQQQPQRRGTHYVIDPVCSPDPMSLANTANWIQMQPLEDAVPNTTAADKRKKQLLLNKYLSFSAEHINRQLMHAAPLVPNGHGPPTNGGDDSDRERSCNEYVPNGFLKYIHKDSIHGSDWSYNGSEDSSGEGRPVEFYIEDEDRFHHRRRSSLDDHIYKGDREVDELFSDEKQKPRKKSSKHQLEHFSSLDRHNNNDELGDRTLQLSTGMEVCTNCLSDRNSSVGRHDSQHGRSPPLFIPPDREILLTPTPRRSRLRSRPKQRSQDRASLESQQRSIEDDSPDFCMSMLPSSSDAAGASLDITSSTENTAEHANPSTIATVPMLSYIDNLANNSTFSTMSTATASSNGSYQSEIQDIPLTDLALPPVSGHGMPSPPKRIVEVSIETALTSSSKSNDQEDTML